MLLYHGSNVAVENPRIIISDRRLDFGAGFYLTSSYEQAERWAELTAQRRGNGQQAVSVFEMDEEKLNILSVLRFEQASVKWLKYVSNNRNNILFHDKHDIVIGPVANDRTMPVLKLYFSGVYTEKEAIRRLLSQKLKDQYAFKTDRALSILIFKEAIAL